MQFKIGRPTLIFGSLGKLNDIVCELSVKLQKDCHRILLIDTLNSINPHHKAYRKINQRSVFKKIYCVRVPRPYDIWARLCTAENFIRHKKIGALIINSINIPFSGCDEPEASFLADNIMQKIAYLTKKYNLVSCICISDSDSETAMRVAHTIVSKTKIMAVTKNGAYNIPDEMGSLQEDAESGEVLQGIKGT